MFEIAGRERPFRLDVDWAPAYELVVSLTTYAQTHTHKDLDLGPTWAKRLRPRLPAAFHEQLAAAHEPKDRPEGRQKPHLHGELHFNLIRDCPEPRDAASYLGWLESLSVGDLYERVAPQWPEGIALPRDLGAQRDRQAALFRLWNEHYFSRVDPAILTGLRDAARRLKAEATTTDDPFDLIERATNGLVLGKAPPPELVLVPQHHMVPFNATAHGHRRQMILYPADVVPASADTPPPSLPRLARALADESRLRILRRLSTDEPSTLTDVARAMKLAQSTVHHHLLLLRVAGLIRVHLGEGHASQYTLRPRAIDELGSRLRQYLTPAPRR